MSGGLHVGALAACIVALAALPAAGAAQSAPSEPLITDRPDFTESAAVVPPRRVQLEAGYTLTRDAGVSEHTLGETLVRAGVHERLELRFELASLAIRDDDGGRVSGRSDIGVGAKVRLDDGAPGSVRPELALLLGTSLPTGSDGFGADRLQPGATLALAWEAGERLGIASNLNYARVAENGTSFRELGASLALALAASDRIGTYAEVYGFAPDERTGSSFLNGGITYLLDSDTQLDARVGAALRGSDARFVGIGISRRF